MRLQRTPQPDASFLEHTRTVTLKCPVIPESAHRSIAISNARAGDDGAQKNQSALAGKLTLQSPPSLAGQLWMPYSRKHQSRNWDTAARILNNSSSKKGIVRPHFSINTNPSSALAAGSLSKGQKVAQNRLEDPGGRWWLIGTSV